MSELVLATIAKEIKAAFRKGINNPDLIMLLYDSVAEPIGLKNKNEDVIVISKGTASKIMNRQKGGEVRDDIRMHSQDEKVLANIKSYVKDCIFTHFLPGKEDQLLNNLTKIVDADQIMNPETKSFLLSLACKDTLAEFVGHSLLYSFSVKNVPDQEITCFENNTPQIINDSDLITRLLLEANGICANDNCNKPLSITKGEGYQLFLERVVIDRTIQPDSFENSIAFCPECAAKFRLRTTDDDIQRVKAIKKRLLQDAADRQMLSESQVTEGIKRVIQKISDSLMEEPEVKLSYDPVTVDQKLLSISKPLCIKVKLFVTEYFNVVHNAFMQMDKAKEIRFKPFSLQMKMNYIQLVEGGTEPDQVFDKLVEWVASITNEDRLWCEIVVSYFVQKCEVYNATPEQTV